MNIACRKDVLRFSILTALAAVIVLLLPGAASAASTMGTSFKKIPVTGAATNGKKFTGSYTIDRFAKRGSKVVAIGRLTGKLGNRKVSKGDVAMPVNVGSSGGGARAAKVCPILDLTLGPLDLKLLGCGYS